MTSHTVVRKLDDIILIHYSKTEEIEINKEAGELFESIGVVMNDAIDGNFSSNFLKTANMSQREFISRVVSKAYGHHSGDVGNAMKRYIATLPNSPVGLTGEKLKEVAEQKLKVIRANF